MCWSKGALNPFEQTLSLCIHTCTYACTINMSIYNNQKKHACTFPGTLPVMHTETGQQSSPHVSVSFL